MKTILKTSASALTLALMMSACGGGGDEEGSLTEFSLSQTELTVAGGTAATGCRSDTLGTVTEGTATFRIFIYGGAAPYQVNNGNPSKIVINRLATTGEPGPSEVGGGGFFTVTFAGGCLSGPFISVEDKLGRVVFLEVTNEEAS